MHPIIVAAAFAASMSAGLSAAPGGDLPAPGAVPSSSRNQDGPAICEAVTFNIYFERGVAGLSAPAEHTLDAASNRVRGCAIAALAIGSNASDVATPAGRHIAGLRGAAVFAALTKRGITADAIIVDQLGGAREPSSASPPHIRVSIQPEPAPVSPDVAAPAPGDHV